MLFVFLLIKKEYEQRSYMRLIGRKFRNVRIYGDWSIFEMEIISKEDAVLVLGKTRCNRYLAKGFIKETELLQKVYKEPLEEWLAINNKSESESMKRGGRQKPYGRICVKSGRIRFQTWYQRVFHGMLFDAFAGMAIHLFYRGKKIVFACGKHKERQPTQTNGGTKICGRIYNRAVNEEDTRVYSFMV